MTPFLEHLPWRVAALAGLMVGAISLATGFDAWTCLLRVGVAFLFFGVIGLGLRTVLGQSTIVSPPVPPADHRGQRFDQTTPEEGTDESSSSASSGSNDMN